MDFTTDAGVEEPCFYCRTTRKRQFSCNHRFEACLNRDRGLNDLEKAADAAIEHSVQEVMRRVEEGKEPCSYCKTLTNVNGDPYMWCHRPAKRCEMHGQGIPLVQNHPVDIHHRFTQEEIKPERSRMDLKVQHILSAFLSGKKKDSTQSELEESDESEAEEPIAA